MFGSDVKQFAFVAPLSVPQNKTQLGKRNRAESFSEDEIMRPFLKKQKSIFDQGIDYSEDPINPQLNATTSKLAFKSSLNIANHFKSSHHHSSSHKRDCETFEKASAN